MKEKALDAYLTKLKDFRDVEFTDEELNQNKLVSVRTFTLEQDAQLYKAKLNSEGIKCFLTNEHSANVMGGYAIEFGGIDLIVLNKDYEAAENIINLMDHRNLQGHPQEYNEMLTGSSDKTFTFLLFGLGCLLVALLMYFMSVAYFSQNSHYHNPNFFTSNGGCLASAEFSPGTIFK